MMLPKPEEVAVAKALAARVHRRDEALQVELRAPIDFCVLVAPLGFRAYCDHVDQQAKDMMTSHAGAVVGQLLWPSLDAYQARAAKRASMAAKIMRQLYTRAGKDAPDPTVELLADVVARLPADAPPTFDVQPGLSLQLARELLAPVDGEPRELWSVVSPLLSLVMTTPVADIFLAAQTAKARATIKQERIVESMFDFAREAVVWSAKPIDALVEDRPALATDINTAYQLMGGEGADASSKSV